MRSLWIVGVLAAVVIGATGWTLICSAGDAPVSTAPATPPAPIQFAYPAAFKCGAELEWKDLVEWNQENRNTAICGNEPYYTVKGKATAPGAYKVLSEIYVPEAKQSWPPNGGGFRQADRATGLFTADFCIPAKGPAREFRFQVYGGDKQPIGERCVIKIRETW